MAPGAVGSLFVSIPAPAGSVLLVLLDSSGRPRPGWPVVLDGATSCEQLLPVEDGSVRVVCAPHELNQELNNGARAFAFDSKGRLFAGWPVDVDGFFFTGRVVGSDLVLLPRRSFGDVVEAGKPSHDVGLVTVAADGSIRSGVRVPAFQTDFEEWAVGRDGIAYGSEFDVGSREVSRITALDLSGVRAGWPVSFEGAASGPAFGPAGRIVLTVASIDRSTSRVLVFDIDGEAVAASSAELQVETAVSGGTTGGCTPFNPRSPVVAQDGTTFVLSEIDNAVHALDRSLAVMRGWPFEPAAPLARRDERYVKEDAYCASLAIPAVGPDGTLYLPLEARATTGGSIVAVGPDGRVRPGWPVELRRPGAEFWSVVVGSDGTVYALAIEPEPGGGSSASALAIAPDSTVLWTTTIIEP